ncbi:UDP-N-acetylmuramate--L-alanine ligase [bacterium]|nr:UDP-N-acetylmuramate--L-alanine ligase [bacterium]
MQQADPEQTRHWHFIGIGGIGMSALAEYLLRQGDSVSGSDLQENERFECLRQLGARITTPHAEELPTGIDRVILSAAVPESNRELVAARRQQLPISKRAQLLGEISGRLKCLAVAGTHGKTGTSALLAETLQQLGESPTAFVGGVMRAAASNLLVGSGELCVCEADEYDRSFLELHPQLALITSLDHDHTDIYPDREALEAALLAFCRQCDLVIHHDEPRLNRLVDKAGRPFRRLGKDDWQLLSLEPRPVGQQVVYRLGGRERTFKLPLAGRHQAANALLVLALLWELGLDLTAAEAALARFSGVSRRMETILTTGNGVLLDDYAHHPAEIEAVLAALPAAVHVIFQPHTYTRTRDFAGAFAEALTAAASVYLLPIFPAREQPLPGIDSELIADEMRKISYQPVNCGEDPLPHLERYFTLGETIITLGAGDIWQWHPQLQQFLEICRPVQSDGAVS